MAQPKKVNYLNNKDILKEIHKSKMSFCWLSDEQYFQHDIIVDDVKKINKTAIKQAKENQASRIQSEAYAENRYYFEPAQMNLQSFVMQEWKWSTPKDWIRQARSGRRT